MSSVRRLVQSKCWNKLHLLSNNSDKSCLNGSHIHDHDDDGSCLSYRDDSRSWKDRFKWSFPTFSVHSSLSFRVWSNNVANEQWLYVSASAWSLQMNAIQSVFPKIYCNDGYDWNLYIQILQYFLLHFDIILNSFAKICDNKMVKWSKLKFPDGNRRCWSITRR